MKLCVAIVAALLIAAVAFVFRFNTLGGTLGGFDNDEFAHLLRSQALLRGEQPLRDFADAELRGAWPSLSYALPAWAQQVWGRTLLAEAYLTAGALALSYAVLFLTAIDLSRGRWVAAIAAVTLAIATAPRLYNYPKVVMLALGAAAIRWAVLGPAPMRLALAGAVTAAATLFRHDYGVYLAAAMAAGLVAGDFGRWHEAGRRLAIFAGWTAAFLLPSAVWVQVHQGIVPYALNALRTSGIEARRTSLAWPSFDLSLSLEAANLVALTYYAFWIIPAAALFVCSWRWRDRPDDCWSAERGTAIALVALAVGVNVFFLRSNLAARFGDAVVPVALLAVWISGAVPRAAAGPFRNFAGMVVLILLLGLIPCAYVYAELAPELEDSKLAAPSELIAQFQRVKATLEQLPPDEWTEGLAHGNLRAARYLAECTNPEDRVLVAAYAPEVLVFARRGFAGGQPTVSLAMYVSDSEQQATLARLKQQSVPVVLATDGFEEEFVTDYPVLARHVAERYHEAGVIAVGENERLRVFVEKARQVPRIDSRSNLPCFR